jgi:ParB family chromosome partitioning protein
MPEEVQDRCRDAEILSRSMLLQIVRQDTVEKMHRLIDRISGEGMTRDEARQMSRPEGEQGSRPRRYTYRYQSDNRDFRFSLTFNKPEVESSELIAVLRDVLRKLEAEAAATPEPAKRAAARRGNGQGRTAAGNPDLSQPPR